MLCEATDDLSVDHVRPLSKGHGLRPGNAVTLCRSCNSSKKDKGLEEIPYRQRFKLLKAATEFKEHFVKTAGKRTRVSLQEEKDKP